MLDFFSNYWPYLLILVVVILVFFALRGVLKGLKARSPFNMENILETVTIRDYPFIQIIKDIMNDFGALKALMPT